MVTYICSLAFRFRWIVRGTVITSTIVAMTANASLKFWFVGDIRNAVIAGKLSVQI